MLPHTDAPRTCWNRPTVVKLRAIALGFAHQAVVSGFSFGLRSWVAKGVTTLCQQALPGTPTDNHAVASTLGHIASGLWILVVNTGSDKLLRVGERRLGLQELVPTADGKALYTSLRDINFVAAFTISAVAAGHHRGSMQKIVLVAGLTGGMASLGAQLSGLSGRLPTQLQTVDAQRPDLPYVALRLPGAVMFGVFADLLDKIGGLLHLANGSSADHFFVACGPMVRLGVGWIGCRRMLELTSRAMHRPQTRNAEQQHEAGDDTGPGDGVGRDRVSVAGLERINNRQHVDGLLLAPIDAGGFTTTPVARSGVAIGHSNVQQVRFHLQLDVLPENKSDSEASSQNSVQSGHFQHLPNSRSSIPVFPDEANFGEINTPLSRRRRSTALSIDVEERPRKESAPDSQPGIPASHGKRTRTARKKIPFPDALSRPLPGQPESDETALR